MAQYAWILEIRPGYEDEYKKRHDEVWPEVIEDTKAAGIKNYSIFRHGLTLFGYFETDDLEAAITHFNASEVNRRWDEYMDPILKTEIDPRTGFPYLLPLQWHMD